MTGGPTKLIESVAVAEPAAFVAVNVTEAVVGE